MISEHRARRYVKRLEECAAPPEVIDDFSTKVLITNQYGCGDPVADLFLETCAHFDFTAPFEGDGISRTVRPHRIRTDRPGYRCDTGCGNTPGEEQAFRRGVDHGAALILRRQTEGATLKEAQKWSMRVLHKWRVRPIQILGAYPWADEPIDDGVPTRSSISPGRRFRIMKRDGYRCRMCGVNADDAATLELDHKVPVAKGGDDSDGNLWTLCLDCNRGKRDHEL